MFVVRTLLGASGRAYYWKEFLFKLVSSAVKIVRLMPETTTFEIQDLW